MGLSLDIISAVGAFAVLGAGAARVAPPMRGAARPTGVVDQGRGTGWITQEPVRPHGLPHAITVRFTEPERTRSGGVVPYRWKRTQGQRAELGGETIRRPARAMGSRSALMVPLTAGNSVQGDPPEGRGASCEQNCPWETRKAHRSL